MKHHHHFSITLAALAFTACGGMEDDLESAELAESEAALSNVDHCAMDFAPNAVASMSEVTSLQGAKYTRESRWPNDDCPQPARNVTILKSPAYTNRCYEFRTVSQGET